jgi:AraC-like DNA-binding protein
MAPIRVAFEHAPPADVREHRRIFACPVTFGADRNEMVFPAAALDLPHARPDPALFALLERYAKGLIDRLPGATTLSARVAEALVPRLPGTPTVETVARALRLSARSLQRYLKEEGTTFATVHDGVRRRHSEVALRDRRRSIAEVARSMGFADQSAFHKAFVRWTGMTPGAYRRASR